MNRSDGRIEAGQPLAQAISARAWNRMMDAADEVLGVNPSVFAGQLGKGFRAENILMVRNDSDADVPAYGVLALNGQFAHIASDQDKSQFTFNAVLRGTMPGGGSDAFCVAVEPIKKNAVGRCAVSGRFPCRVKILYAFHNYARSRKDDVTQLVSAPCGPLRILAKATSGDSAAGTYWAIGLM